MNPALRRPEEILAYRPLRQILGSDPWALWTVGPADSVLTAFRVMADKNIGFLVVMERGMIAGVLSERDCVRRVIVANKTPDMPMPHWGFYINVEGIDAAMQRVGTEGGRVLHGPHEVGGGSWIAECVDPQGAQFAMVSSRR